MESLQEIYARAVVRHGGEDQIEKGLPKPRSRRQLMRLGDDRFLAEMTRCIFRSGFVWRVVENKWPGFEEAFRGFEPGDLARLTESQIDKLATDSRIIRNRRKIESVRDNAAFISKTAAEHGSFGRFIADWPVDDLVGLWLHLRKEGSRLGGDTGPMFLRGVGKDTFLLTRDVTNYLIEQGIVTKKPTGKKDLMSVQAAFNRWAAESERPLCQISRIIALGSGEVYEPES